MRTSWLVFLAILIGAPAVQATPEREDMPGYRLSSPEPDLAGRDGDVFDSTTGGMLYPYGAGDEGRPTDLPFRSDLLTRVRLFDRQTAYRNDRKACVKFELPVRNPRAVTSIVMILDAYNDDSSYLRAIWFEVDGIGGYLGVRKVAQGQHGGGGTIGPQQSKRWRLPLDRFPIAIDGETYSEVDFASRLREPGPHTLCSWISTYAQYGPDSWITLDLEILSETEQAP